MSFAALKEHATPVLIGLIISGFGTWVAVETLDTSRAKAVTSAELEAQRKRVEEQEARVEDHEKRLQSNAVTLAVLASVQDRITQVIEQMAEDRKARKSK